MDVDDGDDIDEDDDGGDELISVHWVGGLTASYL